MASKFVLTAEISLRPPTNIKAIRQQIIAGLKGVQIPIDVKVDAKQVQQAVKQVDVLTKSTDRAAKSADEFGARVGMAIRRIGTYTIGATVFYGMIREIRTAVTETIEFQNEMVKLKQITGQSFASLKSITGEIDNLSTKLGVSSRKLVDVAGTLAQAGLSAKDTQRALAAIAKTDVSPTFENMENTTEAAIAVMSQFKLEAKDLEKTLSSMNTVAAKFAVESSDLAAAVRRAGGAFQTAGGSLDEFNALFTSVRSTTRESAETIATAFKTIFARLQRTDIQQYLRDFGIELTYVKGEAEALGKGVGNFVGGYEAIKRISGALKDLDTTDPRFAQIMKEIGGDRHLSKVVPLVKEFAKAESALNISLASTNSLAEDAATSTQSFTRQIASAREELMAMLRELTDSQGFKVLISGLLDVSKAVIRTVDSIKPLIPSIMALLTLTAIRGGGDFTRSLVGTLKQGVGIKMASGGRVPGSGDSDTVPAMLTPGEYVLNKKAVKAVGLSTLEKVNAQHLNKGGLVGKAQSFLTGQGGSSSLVIGGIITAGLMGLGDSSNLAAKSLALVAVAAAQLFAQFGLLKTVIHATAGEAKGKMYSLPGIEKKRALTSSALTANMNEKKTVSSDLKSAQSNIAYLKKTLDPTNPMGANAQRKAYKTVVDRLAKATGVKNEQQLQAALTSYEKTTQNDQTKLADLAKQQRTLTQFKQQWDGVVNNIPPAQVIKNQAVIDAENEVKKIERAKIVRQKIINNPNRGKLTREQMEATNAKFKSKYGFEMNQVPMKDGILEAQARRKLAEAIKNNPSQIVPNANRQNLIDAARRQFMQAGYDPNKHNFYQSSLTRRTANARTQYKANNLTFTQLKSLEANLDPLQQYTAKTKSATNQLSIAQNTAQSKRAQLTQIASNRQTLRERFKGLEKYRISGERLSSLTQNGVAGLGAAGAVFGGIASDQSSRQLEAFRNGTGSIGNAKTIGAIGGALQYGAGGMTLGAGIGSMAGPIGTAVGAVVGGISGAIYGWMSEAHRIQQEIEKIQFGQKLDKLTTSIAAISSGKATGVAAAFNVRFGASAYANQLQTVSDPGRRADLAAQGKDLAGQLPIFFNSVAGSVKSLEEFKKVVGDDVIGVFNMLTNQTLADFDKNMKKQIEMTNKKIANDERLAKAEAELGRLRSLQLGLGGAVSDARLPNQGMEGGVNALGRIGSMVDNKAFSDSIMKASGLLGPAGEGLGKDAVASATLLQKLPALLTHLASSDPLGTGTDFTQRLSDELGDTPKYLKDVLLATFEKMNTGDSDAEIIKNITQNLSGVMDDVTGTFQAFVDKMAGPIREFLDELNNFAGGMQEVTGKTMGQLSTQMGVFDIQSARSRFNSMASGALSPNFDQLSAIARNKMMTMGGSIDPATLARGLQDSDARAFSLDQQYKQGNFGPNNAKALVDQLSNARTESERYAEALRMVADTSNGLVSIEQERLDFMREQRQKAAGWRERFLGSSDMERQSMNEVAGAAQAISRGGNFNDVRSDLRGSVLAYLKDFDEQTFNKLTGNVPGADENKQAAVVNQLLLNAEEAQKALSNFATNDLTRFVSELGTKFDGFLSRLENNIAKVQQDSETQKGNLENADNAKKAAIEADKQKLSQLAGGLDINAIRGNFADAQNLANMSNVNQKDFEAVRKQYSAAANQRIGDTLGAGTLGAVPGAAYGQLISNTGSFKDFVKLTDQRLGELTEQNILNKSEAEVLRNQMIGNAGQHKNMIGRYDLYGVDSGIEQALNKKQLEFDYANKRQQEMNNNGVSQNQIQQMQQNQVEIARILERLNKNPEMKASGGFIGGSGNRDTVPAMLTPGEFVVRKSVAKKFGPMLQSLNNGQVTGFANGGSVGGSTSINTSALDSSMMTFSANIDKLSKAFESFPSEIQLTAYHKVDVVFNGAQIFESLKPEIKAIAVGVTKQALNKMLKVKFPEVGLLADADIFTNGGQSIGGVNFQG